MVDQNPRWADLPPELLSAIANLLTSDHLCLLAFRSVCRSWRSSCPTLSRRSILAPFIPISIPCRPFSQYHYIGCSSCSFLSVTVIYVLRCPLGLSEDGFSSLTTNTWVLFVDEYKAGKLSVRKPFSTGSYRIPINFPKNINMFDYNAYEIGRFHNISYSHGYDDCSSLFYSECVNKVILLSNGLAAIVLSEDGELGMIRLSVGINEVDQRECSEWKIMLEGKGFQFDDIVDYKGKVLGIDRSGKVYEIGCRLSEMKTIVHPVASEGGRRKRLVESFGSLYLVARCNVKTDRTEVKAHELDEQTQKTKFKVYELNESKQKWVEVSSLGDCSFFIGVDFSFSVRAQDLGMFGKNQIVFEKRSFRSYTGENDHDVVFAKLENSKSSDLCIGVCHLHDDAHFESYRCYLDTLWPPPNWIWSLDRLKRLSLVEAASDAMLDLITVNFKTRVEEPTAEGAWNINDDFRQRIILDMERQILELKNIVIKFQKGKMEYTDADKKRPEAKVNQLDNILEKPGTSRHVMQERLNSYGGLRSPAMLSCSTKDMLRNGDAFVLHFEERATELEMRLKANIEDQSRSQLY